MGIRDRSMDAAAVSMTNGMVFKKEPLSRKMSFPFFFALFQAIMPLLGFIAGDALADIIIDYSSYAVLIILGIIGIKMLYDGIKNIIQPQECIISQKFTYKTILRQALATSIDAVSYTHRAICRRNVE